ncbi:MFS transporter [Streptomyces sp. G44]|uniref:MFS transporter n=1 Tax=Streptomyces sp. G44 TaxID=2807632 RepID=UPI00196034C9|nr:MFS transporter [Streptomyces sp. G44]MBM7168902.1 MFS transporter [Streptomyces sp. G44]
MKTENPVSAPPPASLWRHGDFLKLWGGQSVSLLGTYVTAFVLPLMGVLMLDASAGQLGVLRALEYLPFAVLALPVGLWVDRVRQRRTMIITNFVRAAVLAAVPFIAWLGHLQMGHLYTLALALGAGAVFFDLCYLSQLPTIVPQSQLLDGNSKLTASTSVAEVGGPALGGMLVQILTAPVVLLFDVISYLISAVSLLKIRTPEPPPQRQPAEGKSLRHELFAGVRLIFADPYLRVVAADGMLFNILIQVIEILIIPYAIRDLHYSAGLLGVVLTAMAAGSIPGALCAQRLVSRFGYGRMVMAGVVLHSTGPLILATAAGGRLPTIILIAVGLAVMGFGIGLTNVLGVTLRQVRTPRHLLGRMNAGMRLMLYGAIPLGALLAGLLGETLGNREGLLVAAVALFLGLPIVWFSPVRKLAAVADGAVE